MRGGQFRDQTAYGGPGACSPGRFGDFSFGSSELAGNPSQTAYPPPPPPAKSPIDIRSVSPGSSVPSLSQQGF